MAHSHYADENRNISANKNNIWDSTSLYINC